MNITQSHLQAAPGNTQGRWLYPYYQRIIAETMDTTLADFLAISDRTDDWDKEAFITRVHDMFDLCLRSLDLLHQDRVWTGSN